jgi:signal transduction histidine kinase
LRVQLTVLYAGLFAVLVVAVLAISGLLVRQGSTNGSGVGTSSNVIFGHHFNVGPAVVAVIAGLVALGLAWWVAGRFLRPLRTINAAAREISANDLHRRLGLNGPDDELTELGRTLDELFSRLEGSFEAQRHFVANASHELRTPLAGLQTLLEVALADPDPSTDTLREVCQEALALGQQQKRLVKALLALATSEGGVEQWEPFDLAHITRTVLAERTNEAERQGVHIETSLASSPAAGDPRLVELLVANLIDNDGHPHASP